MKPGKLKSEITDSIVFKSLFGITVLLVVFTVIIGIMGYRAFSDAIMEQYADGAFHTAESASLLIDKDRIDELAESGGETEEYRKTWTAVDSLCNSQGATFIYVIQPDLKDYAHITFLISTMNRNSDYDLYDFGYVRETTNDEYREKYRRLYEHKSGKELVLRNTGYIETDPHITAMIPLNNTNGDTCAILCVQRQMDMLTAVRRNHVRKVMLVLLFTLVLVIAGQWMYLNKWLLKPIMKINAEAGRFADENVQSDEKLTDTIKTNDEIGMLAGSIDDMEEQVSEYEKNLTEVTKENERIGTELDLATRIQKEMLPNTFPAFPEYNQFSLYATMDPAREVGGDFYDFFLVDPDHLCLVIADVSGKGVPAALFMMATKIMIADMVKTGGSPADVLNSVNKAICANNKEKMFVTVWLGILEIPTGKLTCSNAGHEYPALMYAGEKYELLKDDHCFVIGGMKNARYRQYDLMLKKGSKVFVYTDGVTEAVNINNEMFGTDRMIDAINKNRDKDPEEEIKAVREAVDAFVGDAERFDDMTMLCLEYTGKRD